MKPKVSTKNGKQQRRKIMGHPTNTQIMKQIVDTIDKVIEVNDALASKMDSLESQLSNLESSMNSLESDISSMIYTVDTIESNTYN